MMVDGESASGSLFDFGLYFFHNAQELIDRGSGPYFYLPKLQSHREARLGTTSSPTPRMPSASPAAQCERRY